MRPHAIPTTFWLDSTATGEAAVLLNDWEHMTPLWYGQFVEDRWPDEADVRPILVSTAQPWLESVFAYLPGGPVYLSNYRREIVDAGFRLRPDGDLYQVVEPGEHWRTRALYSRPRPPVARLKSSAMSYRMNRSHRAHLCL